jgi:hypothetical protein
MNVAHRGGVDRDVEPDVELDVDAEVIDTTATEVRSSRPAAERSGSSPRELP